MLPACRQCGSRRFHSSRHAVAEGRYTNGPQEVVEHGLAVAVRQALQLLHATHVLEKMQHAGRHRAHAAEALTAIEEFRRLPSIGAVDGVQHEPGFEDIRLMKRYPSLSRDRLLSNSPARGG